MPALPGLIAVQCNLDRGGKFTGAESGPVTWDTAKGFARALALETPDAAIVGMQELDSDQTAAKVRELLHQSTGKDWTFLWTPQGLNDRGDGLAIFWRRDLISMERDLGKTPLDFLDDGAVLSAMGAWFRHLESSRTFGFFTARLAPPSADRGAMPVTTWVQRMEAWRLREWIARVMEPHPDDARILAVDLESSWASPAWFELRRDFEPDADKRFTVCSHTALFKGKRYDYLWWDGHSGPRLHGGRVGRPGRSEHFGGSHRFVWAKLKL